MICVGKHVIPLLFTLNGCHPMSSLFSLFSKFSLIFSAGIFVLFPTQLVILSWWQIGHSFDDLNQNWFWFCWIFVDGVFFQKWCTWIMLVLYEELDWPGLTWYDHLHCPVLRIKKLHTHCPQSACFCCQSKLVLQRCYLLLNWVPRLVCVCVCAARKMCNGIVDVERQFGKFHDAKLGIVFGVKNSVGNIKSWYKIASLIPCVSLY